MATAALTAALSIPSQVETIGALAGLAAILGLAVMSMLYFAQARELRRLREWAGRAPERAAELQERVAAGGAPRRGPAPARAATTPATPAAQAAQGQAAAAPRPATASAAAAAGGAAATAAPAQPAAVPNGQTGAPGAPAAPTTAGTPAAPTTAGAPAQPDAPERPAPGPPGAPAQPQPGAPARQPAADQPTTASPAARPAGQPAPPGQGAPQPAQPVRPAPAGPPPRGVPRTAAAGAAAARPTARPRPAAALRGATPSTTVPPRRSPGGGGDGGRGSRRGLLLVAGAAVIVVVAIVFAVTQLGGDDNPGQSSTQARNQIAPARSPEPAGNASDSSRSKTTLAVLNGTTVPGLARSVADKLEARKYKIGTVTNAPDQQRSATQIAYQPGSVRMARDVARIIDVGADAIVPIDEVTSATAGPDALIVVTVGSDQSR